MLGRLLSILNSLVAVPTADSMSAAQAEQNFRNLVWAERQNGEPIRNADRLAWFCGVSPLLKLTGVPEWMGPWPQTRLAAGAGAVSSQPVPASTPEPEAPRKAGVHLVATGKKAGAR